VWAKAFGDKHPIRGSLWSNVATLELQRENWPAALAGYRKALALVEVTEGPEHIDASGLHKDIARVLAEMGKLDEAFAEMDRTIAILEKAGASGEPRMIGALAELAEYQVHAKQPAKGVASAERSLAIIKKRPADANPVERGEVNYVLARALWDANRDGDRARARALVAEAVELIRDPKQREMYQQWLTDHPLP
jgi:tetratricopeptide (TPR) repeat protein